MRLLALAHLLLVLLPPAGAATPPSAETANEPTTASDLYKLSETIAVELRSLTIRVVDNQGRPILDLEPDDFELRVGKRSIPVHSADWIRPVDGRQEPDRSPRSVEPLSSSLGDPERPPKPTMDDGSNGNLIVLFVQSDFNGVRVKGHLRMLPFVREFLSTLPPEDWVAAVSFDSHLKLWQDFTRDRTAIADAVDRAVRFGAQPSIGTKTSPSLASALPPDQAKKAANPEKALKLTARSLQDLPGEKVIVYLGWGLGRYGSSGFRMTPEYDRTLDALQEARASVFVIDVTDADYHTLELGIRQVAEDTGGTYAKTNHYARREMLRLTETISGYYLITVDASLLPEDPAKLKLRLKKADGTVLLRDRRIAQHPPP